MKKSPRPRWPYLLLVLPSLLVVVLGYLQNVVAHREPPFIPTYAQIDLTDLWQQDSLSDADYKTLLYQTGLGVSAVDKLRTLGDYGWEQALALQTQMFDTPTIQCLEMLPLLTREERMITEDGAPYWAPPLLDLKPGDILVSLSTHSFGWRHGHAGLVLDDDGTTLEAAALGSNSMLWEANAWRRYSSYAVLRLKDAPEGLGQEIADYASAHLLDVPYSLLAGLGKEKAPPVDEDFTVQCDYLPWYAYQQFGYDLDSDGGQIVTTADLMASPYLEVVQCYGFDPKMFE